MENNRITPEQIGIDLPKNTIFVFGSNEDGIHGAGAARLAYEAYGAELNQGFGLMGRSFGIPTKDWDIQTLPLEAVKFYIERFLDFTQRASSGHRIFYVTKIGCGLAGFTPEQIAPLFAPALDYENVYLPEDFINIINNQKMSYVPNIN